MCVCVCVFFSSKQVYKSRYNNNNVFVIFQATYGIRVGSRVRVRAGVTPSSGWVLHLL